MSFEEIEDTDGVRFSWNVWPNTRLEVPFVLSRKAPRPSFFF